MIEYCASDVKVLFLGCIQFEKCILRLSHGRVSFLNGQAVTIAGISSMLFRAYYMPSNSIGRNPELGYARSQTSVSSLIFFKWLNMLRDANGLRPIKYAGNMTKEVRVGRFHLDGLDDKRIYEYSGIFFAFSCPFKI